MLPDYQNSRKRGSLPPQADPHGHAALLLVEGLIHALLARSIIGTADAIDIVESADSVQVDIAEAADEAGASMWRSHTLLNAIAMSLMADGHGGSVPPNLAV